MKKEKRKKKKSNIITSIILVAAVCVFVYSLFMLLASVAPYFKGGEEYDDIKKHAITQKVTKDESEDESEEAAEEEAFLVDFEYLLQQNPDTVAWLRLEEPEIISYPVVKSKDNKEYLTKTFTANDNKLGAIFMDMNCESDFSSQNTIIYGHNMKIGGEMFSQLNAYADESFCKQHPFFYIYTPDNKKLTYQVFSAGVVKDTSDKYKISFASDEEFVEYLKMCKSNSNYQVEVDLSADSKVVSLSTCTNVRDDERFMLQGVLIKEEENK